MVEQLLRAIGVIFAMVVVLFVVNHLFDRLIKRTNGIQFNFFKSVIDVIIIAFSIYVAVSQFDEAQTISRTVLASGTVLIAVVTFAAQLTLGNIISGFTISCTKPCDLGQHIKVYSGDTVVAEGIVVDMTSRHEVLRQMDGQAFIVPNSVIDSSVIFNCNYTGKDEAVRRMEIEVGYDTDIEKATAIIQDICAKEPLITSDDGIAVGVAALTANGIKLAFTVKSASYEDLDKVRTILFVNIVRAFRENGISIPYQTITIDNAEKK